MYLARLKRLLANKGAGRHIWSDHYLAAKHPFSPLSRVNTCYWVSGAQLTAGGRRWAHSASEVDKVVAGEVVVEVLGAYHVAGHNSDRLSHPDSPTEAGPIYPHGLFAGPQVLNPTANVHWPTMNMKSLLVAA